MRECPSCGAPWKRAAERVCAYCHYELGAPMPTARPSPRPPPSISPVLMIVVMGGLICAAGLALVVALAVGSQSSAPVTVAPPPRPPRPPRPPAFRGPACPLGDVNGD